MFPVLWNIFCHKHFVYKQTSKMNKKLQEWKRDMKNVVFCKENLF